MPAIQRLVRFGVFELDVNTGELCKSGRRLKLQVQPYRLLNLLLERPGEPVTRDKLKEALWPADTFVDFDHSLNAAVAKLRQTLGDSADNPRFIETLARRGYRFIAPVEFVGDAVIEAAPAVAVPIAAVKRTWLLPAIAGAGLLTAVYALWFPQRTPNGNSRLVQLTEGRGLNTNAAISADGKLLAYASDRGSGGNLNIWIQQMGVGGSAVQLTHDDRDASEPAFSPDGNKIAFHSQKEGGGVYVVASIGGEAVRRASFGRTPRFSPDGRWLAYWASESGQAFIVPAEGGEPRRIGLDLRSPSNPVWSPDSKHLLVYVPPDKGLDWNTSDWWLVHLDGSPSQRTGHFAALVKQGFSLGYDRVPYLSQWTQDSLIFSAAFGDAINGWRMPVSSGGQNAGLAVRLTSGVGLESSPALSASGDVVFTSLTRNAGIWSLAGDTNQGKLADEARRLTEGSGEIMPSASTDGNHVAFAVSRKKSGAGLSPESLDVQIHVRDLSSGKETALPRTDAPQWRPQISRDGSMVAYTLNKPGAIMAAPAAGGPARTLVAGANFFAWDWSLDRKRLLFNARDQRLHSLEVASGKQKLFLYEADREFYQARFSPDDKAISVLGCFKSGAQTQGCQVFVVPLDNGMPSSAKRWLGVDHPSYWDDKPRWSPDGKTLYFVSDRDGYFCLWAQRMESGAKRLIGAPFSVHHFHSARLAMTNIDSALLEIDVAKDKIVLGLGEKTGNIWSLRQK